MVIGGHGDGSMWVMWEIFENIMGAKLLLMMAHTMVLQLLMLIHFFLRVSIFSPTPDPTPTPSDDYSYITTITNAVDTD